MPKLPTKAAALIMPFLLSIFMTFVVSLVSTLNALGLDSFSLTAWFAAWGLSWVIAFPTLLLVLPLVKTLTAYLVR